MEVHWRGATPLRAAETGSAWATSGCGCQPPRLGPWCTSSAEPAWDPRRSSATTPSGPTCVTGPTSRSSPPRTTSLLTTRGWRWSAWQGSRARGPRPASSACCPPPRRCSARATRSAQSCSWWRHAAWPTRRSTRPSRPPRRRPRRSASSRTTTLASPTRCASRAAWYRRCRAAEGGRVSMVKVPPGQCPSSAAAPPRGAWRLRAARHSQEEAGPLSVQPLPRVLEPAASKAAHFTCVL